MMIHVEISQVEIRFLHNVKTPLAVNTEYIFSLPTSCEEVQQIMQTRVSKGWKLTGIKEIGRPCWCQKETMEPASRRSTFSQPKQVRSREASPVIPPPPPPPPPPPSQALGADPDAQKVRRISLDRMCESKSFHHAHTCSKKGMTSGYRKTNAVLTVLVSVAGCGFG